MSGFYQQIIRQFAIACLTGLIGVSVVMSAQAQAPEGTFGPELGSLVNPTSTSELKQALETLELNNFETSMVESTLGHIAYQIDDINTAIHHFERAIKAGGLNSAESRSLQANIAQLMIADGQYQSGADALVKYMEDFGEDPKFIEYTVQGYVESENYEAALPWAKKWFDGASPRERKHYDLMHFLYDDQKMRAEQLTIIDELIRLWPQDRYGWDSKVSLLALMGQEKDSYLAYAQMYDEGLFKTESHLIRLIEYHTYYEAFGEAYDVMKTEMENGRIGTNAKNLKRLEELKAAR